MLYNTKSTTLTGKKYFVTFSQLNSTRFGRSGKNLWTLCAEHATSYCWHFCKISGKVGRLTIRDWLVGSHQSLLSVFSLYSVRAVAVLLSDGGNDTSVTSPAWHSSYDLKSQTCPPQKALYFSNTQKLEWISLLPSSYFSLPSSFFFPRERVRKLMRFHLLFVSSKLFAVTMWDAFRRTEESLFSPKDIPLTTALTLLSLSVCLSLSLSHTHTHTLLILHDLVWSF